MSIPTFEICSDHQSGPLFQLFYNHLPPGKGPNLIHFHSELEITMFRTGSALYKVNKCKMYEIKPGDIFIFRSNEDHVTTEVFPGDDIRSIGVHFSPQFVFSTFNNLFDIKYMRAFYNQSPNFEHRLPNNSATAKLRELLEDMYLENDSKSPDYELIVKIKLLTLLVELNRYCDGKGAADPKILQSIHKHQPMLKDSIQYIDENLTSPITLDTLAHISNLSKSYYSRLFKEVYRINVWDYILGKRIRLAEEYLINTDLSMIEIGYLSGFNNYTNFNRIFKKYTGLTPSQFQKSCHENLRISSDPQKSKTAVSDV